MTTMSESHLRLFYLSLLLLCFVSPSSFLTISSPGTVACRPHQIQAFTQFKNEFDTRGCNHSDSGVLCDSSTGAVTELRVRACLSGILKPNSRLFGFHQLRYVDINYNNFTSSSLPSEFGNLNKLQVLSLYSNGFLGQVPSSFSNLSLLSFLDLSYNQFSGNLNPNSSLFGLHHLSYLNLAYNNFDSSLPSEFGNLYRLETLSLSSNGFSGQVPPIISNLTQLTQLYLNLNELTGSFPLVQNLTKLSILDLATNNFSGAIPSSLLTMPFLSHLILNKNHLTGSIEFPNSSSSSRLQSLLLGNNHFEIQILEPISKLINLENLDLSYLNKSYPIDLKLFSSLISLVRLELSGNIISHASLSSDTNIPLTLESLSLERCGISEFPNILKTLQKLEYINLSHNRIKGKIPELPLSVEVFSVGNNSFTGEIPLSICNGSSLEALDLSHNNFTGPIPQCLSNFKFVTLRGNNFEGSIPDEFYVGASLRTLDVGYNRLTGKLPRSLLNCSSLTFLSVDHNRIEDTFPFWLKPLPNLKVLTLRSNKFYGPISPPHQAPLEFPELRIFEIADNKLTGSLPPSFFVNWKASSLTMNEDANLYMIHSEVGYSFMDFIDLKYKGLSMERNWVLTSYAAIDFSGNRLEGQIPESIGLLKALIALNLSNNAFTGHIPLSFGNLMNLESLDLSRNQLSGTIPNGIKTLSFLAYINVSHNQLKGEIPQGTQIIGQPKSSFEGNARLCGLPLEESCFGTRGPPMQHHKEEDEEEEEQVLSWKAVAIGYVPGVLFGLAIAHVIASYKPEWLAKITGLNKHRSR